MYLKTLFREAKQVGGSLNLKQSYPYIETLKEINISCDGNKVSITVTKVIRMIMFIWFNF